MTDIRAALLKYGDHLPKCETKWYPSSNLHDPDYTPCSCGFEAALAAASPEPERLPGGMKRDHEGRLMPGWGDPEPPTPIAPPVPERCATCRHPSHPWGECGHEWDDHDGNVVTCTHQPAPAASPEPERCACGEAFEHPCHGGIAYYTAPIHPFQPPAAPTAEALRSERAVEGVVRYRRSSTDKPKVCICCPGEPSHVFGYCIEVPEGTPDRNPNGSLHGSGTGWVFNAIRRLPEGTPVRLTLAAVRADERTRLSGEPVTPTVEALREHPGEHHTFSMTCDRCGKRGYVNLSIIGPDERLSIEPIGELP